MAAAPAAPGSLRTLDADLDTVNAKYLGQSILPPGGGGAMKASAMAVLAGTPTHPPRFNKYSGIQVNSSQYIDLTESFEKSKDSFEISRDD